jgi:hypothetical protein
MRGKRLSIGLSATLAFFTVTMFATSTYAGTEQVLYSFNNNGTDGYNSAAGLIFDAAGNLYGTTKYGGSDYGCGTVFELIKPATNGGSWSEETLYSFDPSCKDGGHPTTGLIFDGAGNLYGTAGGIVFELTPPGWTEKILYTFPGDAYPLASLIFDAAGNLYGTTDGGGTYDDGTVFELIRPGHKGRELDEQDSS